MNIDRLLDCENFVEANIVESFDCRFMGTINTFEYNINGEKGKKAIVRKDVGGANILPIDSEGNILLETQYRFPLRKLILETPAGRTDEGEAFDECAKRELREETGHTSEDIEWLNVVYPDPNFTNEQIGNFIAKNIKLVGGQILDTDENVNVYKVSLDVAKELIRRNIICEERTVSAIAQAILINRIECKEDSTKDEKIEEIMDIMKKDEEKLKETETGVSYTYDCEFGNVTDYHIITSNKQVAKRECMHLEPINVVVPISEEQKIGVKIKYMLAMDDNSIELPKVETVNDELESLGNIYTCVGYADSLCNIYILRNQKETDEYIWLSRDETLDLIRQNKIKNGVVLAVLLKYLLLN